MVNVPHVLSHVAILVPDVDKAAACFERLGLRPAPAQNFDGEGTKEIYVGDYDKYSSLLLLVQPTREDSDYMRALKKRGPGVHHIAVDVTDVEHALESLKGSGWFLHLNAIRSLRTFSTVYLARPQVPAIIEIQKKEAVSALPHLVSEIGLPFQDSQGALFQALSLPQVKQSLETYVCIDSKKIKVSELV